jgi:hypothetical protein
VSVRIWQCHDLLRQSVERVMAVRVQRCSWQLQCVPLEQLRLLAIFDCDQQDQLAHVVYTMTAFREHCLSLPHGSHIAITNVQQIVEEDVELTRIQ